VPRKPVRKSAGRLAGTPTGKLAGSKLAGKPAAKRRKAA
jgi:hypothetical protein